MKVWISKYALTQGIFEAEVTSNCLDVDPTGNMIATCEGSYMAHYHGEGREWHKDKQSAIAKAEEMRKKKIASLKKQIEKLEKMEFV